VGTGGIAWRASCGHWESVQWVDGPLSVPLHLLGTGGFIGGPNVAIGCLFDGLMALLQSHSMLWVLGDFLEGLMWPLGK